MKDIRNVKNLKGSQLKADEAEAYKDKERIEVLEKRIKEKMKQRQEKQNQTVYVVSAKEPKHDINHVFPFHGVDKEYINDTVNSLKQKGWRNIKVKKTTAGEIER